ncbi:MAG: hypothetical protein ACU0DK_04460 [Pseudooceanicola sp.]
MTRLLLALLLLGPAPGLADAPKVVAAKAKRDGMGWHISVTLEHPDSGWDHYANGWEVLNEAGEVLGTRKLHHPHVNEQPFTRSLHDMLVPDGTRTVYIRAWCSQEHETSELFPVELKRY